MNLDDFEELVEKTMDEKFKAHVSFIDERFRSYESRFNTQLSWVEKQKNKIEYMLPSIKQELEDAVKSLLESSEFIKRMQEHFKKYIEQEIASQIRNEELHDLAKSLVIQKVMDDFKPIISQVVDKVLSNMNRNLEKRYEVTKQMVYSIEKEIQHLTIRSGIGADEEEIIRKAISSVQKEQLLAIETKL